MANSGWKARLVVGVLAVVLFAAWMLAHLPRLVTDQNGTIRFVLGLLLAAVILLRRDPGPATAHRTGSLAVCAAALVGTLCTVGGMIFHVGQFEWLGLLLVLLACLRWVLPPKLAGNAAGALFVLYWAHPVPSQLFAPAELTLRAISVAGSEWLMHMFNARVWADGLALRTATGLFDIPPACSGMRTATTVMLLALGLGIARRFRPAHVLYLVAAALVQAVLLNMMRISIMVSLAPRFGERAIEYLHNSTGFVVVAGVFLLYLEITLLDRWRRRRHEATTDFNLAWVDRLSEYPPFWRFVIRHRLGMLVTAVLLTLVGIVIFRSRPYHRATLIRDVAEGLRDAGDLPNAERAARYVQQRLPGDEEWTMITIRILLMRGKYRRVLDEIARVPGGSPARRIEKNVVRAYSLMGLGRAEEAARVVAQLPERVRRNDPLVAMILAELARFSDDPDTTATKVRVAARWPGNLPRVRALYPYLRLSRKWDAIATTDDKMPYSDISEVLASTEAHMNLNQAARVAAHTLEAIEQWPDDPRVLEPIFFMTLKRYGDWEERFAKHLGVAAQATDNVGMLYGLTEKCFRLSRPDLAWALYRRIEALDPAHPLLDMIVVRYGHRWFTFRRKSIGLNALHEQETTDLRPYFLLGRRAPAWVPWTERIPLADDLLAEDATPFRRAALKRALAAFNERDRALSLFEEYEYVRALDIANEVDAARERLFDIAARYPGQLLHTREKLATIYERRGDWQNVYETLRETVPAAVEGTDPRTARLSLQLAFFNAQSELRLGLAAFHTARITAALFPNFPQSHGILATALLDRRRPAEALHLLSQPLTFQDRQLDMLESEALYATERYRDSIAFARASMIPVRPLAENAPQAAAPIPAETSVVWHWIALPSQDEFDRTAALLAENVKVATSPYLKDLLALWIAAYSTISNRTHRLEAGATGSSTGILPVSKGAHRLEAGATVSPLLSPERWEAVGRDRVEKGVALYQLTLFLCRAGDHKGARKAAERAAALFPECPAVWQVLISLSAADAAVIEQARAACPDDPETWLAELVATCQRTDDGQRTTELAEWARTFVNDAVARNVYPSDTMARAADYLFRGKLYGPAAVAARDAVKRARGHLPAYVVGLKCALVVNDYDWAVACTHQALQASLRPPEELYRQMVRLKAADGHVRTDTDMLQALSSLKAADPKNPLWAQMLGYVRYRRGGGEVVNALYEMSAAIEQGATNKLPYQVAAHAARAVGNTSRAIDILEEGLKQHPDDAVMLNNFIYTLAASPTRSQEALEHLPRLATIAAGNPDFMDTVAFVYLRTGRFREATAAVSDILRAVEKGENHWFRARIYSAEIALRQDNPARARALIDDALEQSRGIGDEDILHANRLLREAKAKEEGK